MKALTVQQPWAWAIIWGGKDVENRTWRMRHRGPLLIHAGKAADNEAVPFVAAHARLGSRLCGHRGALLGVVDVVGWHEGSGDCCHPWGASGQGHIELANPRPFVEPIPCRGALGLWTPPSGLADAIAGALRGAA